MGVSADGRRHVTADPEAVDDSRCTVLHVDMDAFFALVELRRRPELADRPMMVAGAGARSVVLSATYPARTTGIRSGMPVGRARSLCPGIAVVPPDHALYREVSDQVMRMFADVTPLVEPLSVDEAFLDVSGARRTAGRPVRIAAALRRRIRDELGLSATVGAAATKFVAKLASGLAKPDGLLVVPPGEVVALLHPLPVRALWGVGPALERTLLALGLTTVGDIAAADRRWLERRLGVATGSRLHELAMGHDERAVTPDNPEVSLGAETTFDLDTNDRDFLHRVLLGLADRTARRARAAGLRGRTISIKVRYEDFSTITRSVTMAVATDVGRAVYTAAVALFDRLDPRRPIRLVGVRLEGLDRAGAAEQLTIDELTDAGPGWQAAEHTVDQVAERFGATALRPASLLGAAGSVRPDRRSSGREVPDLPRPEPGVRHSGDAD